MPDTRSGTDNVGRVLAVLSWWGGWIPAFVLTCAIEVPLYLVLFELLGLRQVPSGRARSDLPVGRAVALALALNAITHPVFWWAALGLQRTSLLVLAELVVVAVEGLLIFAVLRRRPVACLLCALVANAASAVLGSAILAAASPFAVISSVVWASTMSIWPG
jgi:hypothetical protein